MYLANFTQAINIDMAGQIHGKGKYSINKKITYAEQKTYKTLKRIIF